MPKVVDDQFVNQLKAHGVYDQFLAKTPADEPHIPITGFFFSLTQVLPVNLIDAKDFEDVLNDLANRSQLLD